MASGTIWLSSSKAWEGVIRWSAAANIPGNYSDLSIYAGMWKTDGYPTSSNSPTGGTITINGSSFSLIEHQEFEGEVCIFEDTIRIDHNGDGTKTVAISLSCSGQPGTKLSGVTLSGSGSATLDPIYRSSTISASSGTLGASHTITIDKAASSLTHTITYKCGTSSGTIATKTSASSVNWTPPLSLASANTNGASVTVSLTLTTYSGSTAVGTHNIDVSFTIPASAAPTFTVTFADAAGYKDTYGDYIQRKSKLKITVEPTTLYGATVKSYKITANGENFSRAEATTSELSAAGSIPVYVAVTDSRNKTKEESFTISVRGYSLPAVSKLTVKRCNSDGTANDQGEYVQVTFSASATTLDGENTVSYKLQYRKNSASSFTSVNLTQYDNVFSISDKTYTFAADTGSSYDVQLTVTDAFGSVTRSTIASTAATIMHFKANGKGIGLGKVSEADNAVDIGWNVNMNGHCITNVADPQEDGDGVNKKYADSMIGKVYPVGAIYISTVSTSPASLFGGTWEIINNKFLLAGSSGTYPYGSVGGAATHKLTVNEMPSHQHTFEGKANVPVTASGNEYWAFYYEQGSANTAPINSTGGGAAHNNMPPYLAVYMWKRIA